MKEFDKICRDIKSIKIQGATNVAKAGLRAYYLSPSKETKKILFSLRPTEPALFNALNLAEKFPEKKIISHFNEAQEKINFFMIQLLKKLKPQIIFTHCHSTNVTKSLINAKNNGIKFEVFNTETRPLFQGRRTARELSKNKIKVTNFVDSAMATAIKKSDLILIGADAILNSGIINKVGSESISIIAKKFKKKIFIVADSWKFYPKNVKIEERNFHEVWKNVPKNILVENPAFEKIQKNYISGIISEFGILKYSDFIKKAKTSN